MIVRKSLPMTSCDNHQAMLLQKFSWNQFAIFFCCLNVLWNVHHSFNIHNESGEDLISIDIPASQRTVIAVPPNKQQPTTYNPIVSVLVVSNPTGDSIAQQQLSTNTPTISNKRPFATRDHPHVWTSQQISTFARKHTSPLDPRYNRKLRYSPRDRFQFRSEEANNRELVQYITNTGNLQSDNSTIVYNLLIRVNVQNATRLAIIQDRWIAILQAFRSRPFLNIRVECIVSTASRTRRHLLVGPSTQPTDWILIVDDITYVHLEHLARRLFAEYDPTTRIQQGLLDGSGIPMVSAGMLVSQLALLDIQNNSTTQACISKINNMDQQLREWAHCAGPWASTVGFHPHSLDQMIAWTVDTSLFSTNGHVYSSVGGTVQATARLPITFGGTRDDTAFENQLLADTQQARIQKVMHQMWLGPKGKMSAQAQAAQKGCQKMHEEQGWRYLFWDDDRLAQENLATLPEPILSNPDLKYKADLTRLLILHKYGGVYLDIDALCLRPFDPIIDYAYERKGTFLGNYESQRQFGRQIANGILAVAPASPVITALLLHIGHGLASRKGRPDRPAFEFTGPWKLTEVREQWESWTQDHLVLLSSSAFIPMLFREDDKAIKGKADALGMAHGQGSYTFQLYQGTVESAKSSMFKQIVQQAAGDT